MTLADLLAAGRKRLQGCSDSAALDARLLLCHACEVDQTRLYREPEALPEVPQREHYWELIERRQQGEPVAYLLGYREFYGERFRVTPATLIPRPDTELLVERTLKRLPADQPLKLADLGSGSGAIGVTLARLRPAWQLLAVDCSEAALAVARANAEAQGVTNITFRHASWLEGQTEPLDAIVCNPPYIAADDPHLSEGDVRFEPSSALVAANEGMADFATISQQSLACLKPGGWLLFEHGYSQAAALRQLLADKGFERVTSRLDLAGHERVTEGCLPC